MEGVFNLASTDVYLQDNLLCISHNLKQSPYIFNTAVGTFNNRFLLKYTKTTKGKIDKVDKIDCQKTVIVTKKDELLIIKSAVLPIQSIAVFNLLGRKIFENNLINKNELVIDSLVSDQQPIIVNIVLENGTVVSRKIVF